jgi:hypothetical protein
MNMRLRFILCGTFAILMSSCADLESSSKVCRLMPELESSSVALDRAFDDLAMVDSSLLRSSLTVLGGTLAAMREDAPLAIAESLETLDRAYREVNQALANVDFDGRLAINDGASLNAIDGLKRSENLQASQRLERFVESRCKRSFDAPVPPQFGGGTTLPTPIQTPTDSEEYPFVVNDEESVLASYGYVLVADRGVSVDKVQATCIGRVVGELSLAVTAPDDEDLDRFVDDALERCIEPLTTNETGSSIAGD